MRILIVNTLYHPFKVGGAEVSVQLLAEGLVKAGHQVRVVSLHDQNVKKINRVNGVEVSYLPLFNKYWPYSDYVPTKLEKLVWHFLDNYNIVMAKRVESEILDFKPDIIHTNNLAGFSVSIWSKVSNLRIPLVHTSRDYYLFHPNNTLYKNNDIQDPNSIEVRLFSIFKKIISKKVQYYIGISDFIKEFHLKNNFFDKNKSSFIYNAVDMIKKENNVDRRKKIGYIGSLTKDKGFDKYCEIAKNNNDKYDFLAAGRFKKNTEGLRLEKEAELSNVKLLGFVEFKDFLKIVDSVVLPIQWNEPFGRVIVESCLAGVDVYSNKVGGISELYKIFPNLKEIKNGDLFINEKRVDNTVISHIFSVENVVFEHLKIYEKVLSEFYGDR
ncbi:glycosyltransferase family 4 protein [Acinetobacter sp. NEB149]|uniref:glycosyltransferase n=1 Tax=Acinetobacter sp. NEB149 TaxID=2725684 RepID=UPI0014490BD9|nr:glycosyltransferase [Acinetobacter sp. NEB149]QJB49871.1 glycosyltransferase family 4 protein [Acinetobacter sp. NEB149]